MQKGQRCLHLCPSQNSANTVSYTHLDVYKRQDSQFITDDMENTARQVISIVCRQLPLFSDVSITLDPFL